MVSRKFTPLKISERVISREIYLTHKILAGRFEPDFQTCLAVLRQDEKVLFFKFLWDELGIPVKIFLMKRKFVLVRRKRHATSKLKTSTKAFGIRLKSWYSFVYFIVIQTRLG